MHLIEFKNAKYFGKDIILPYCHKRGQGLPQHCHMSNQLVGINNDLLFNGKNASMHLIEFKNAKYFEKRHSTLLHYSTPPPPPQKNFNFQEKTEKTMAHCSQRIAFLLKILPSPPTPSPPMNQPIKLGNYATNFSSNTATETNSL